MMITRSALTITRIAPHVAENCQRTCRRSFFRLSSFTWPATQTDFSQEYKSKDEDYSTSVVNQLEQLEEQQRLFQLVTVKVKGNDEPVLDSYTQFVSRAAKVLELDISERVILPMHIEKHTVLKSPHIYAKHRAQYEVRTHGRLFQIRQLTEDTADTFLEYIQRNLPEGVSMKIEQTELEELPEYIQPPKMNTLVDMKTG